MSKPHIPLAESPPMRWENPACDKLKQQLLEDGQTLKNRQDESRRRSPRWFDMMTR